MIENLKVSIGLFTFIIERLTIDRYVHFDNQELKLKVRDSPFEVMIQANKTDLVQTYECYE